MIPGFGRTGFGRDKIYPDFKVLHEQTRMVIPCWTWDTSIILKRFAKKAAFLGKNMQKTSPTWSRNSTHRFSCMDVPERAIENVQYCLVVFRLPLWKMMDFVSWDDGIPNLLWEVINFHGSKPPTKIYYILRTNIPKVDSRHAGINHWELYP